MQAVAQSLHFAAAAHAELALHLAVRDARVPAEGIRMTPCRNDTPAHEAPEYSIHDVLVSPHAVDPADFPRLLGGARHVCDRGLAGLRTLAKMLRAITSGDEAPDADLVHDAGMLVADLADYIDAMIILQSHAEHAWEKQGCSRTNRLEA
ncbi:hypothetical protein [Tahibacter amnicola]|uniref:Uncharacterized protein n=1 Tax=Tahibacter amnicola TaxID=2976241 RepID=A0ABY6BH79_9GAMM|nr:hypothetical protein [Tahibacter amnicola]UXI68941.1 hypothetical protein N4264_04600 [Tahibacter amnicola]